ncbi:MAG: ABC transporter ATP-binding protein [Treponema sp.]|jgi:oligopeptide/dipeptide ABC transporter ATP-binding protein|nr:ABC transporter ATP-binding protein [Treponema sp.]
MTGTLLSVRGLRVGFETEEGMTVPVDGVDFHVGQGEILGIVGESGCGKSVSSFAVMGLLPQNGRVLEGSILFEDTDLVRLDEKSMCKIRGSRISMIFQDPLTSLTPSMTIGRQVMEPFILHRGFSAAQARTAVIEILGQAGIPSPRLRFSEYPHQLSGGMRQRVMIAMALAGGPKLLIADEPTTALDVSIQAQILALIRSLRETLGMAVILITHDMGVIAEMADRVMVMYAGKGVEYAPVADIFQSPKHPYTRGLLRSIPSPDRDVDMLDIIPGTVPDLSGMSPGCRFFDRCGNALAKCGHTQPELTAHEDAVVACFLYDPPHIETSPRKRVLGHGPARGSSK